MPFLSVMIPTTRPHYLKYSLTSVLAQSDADIEVVIAFNPPRADVELGDIGDDPRVKVVTAPRFLPMHDNWDNGFINTTGEWVTLLGDDDCYVPHAVGRMRDAVARMGDSDMLLWTWGSYIAPDCPIPKTPNTRGVTCEASGVPRMLRSNRSGLVNMLNRRANRDPPSPPQDIPIARSA